jgi:hypothetical protein
MEQIVYDFDFDFFFFFLLSLFECKQWGPHPSQEFSLAWGEQDFYSFTDFISFKVRQAWRLCGQNTYTQQKQKLKKKSMNKLTS